MDIIRVKNFFLFFEIFSIYDSVQRYGYGKWARVEVALEGIPSSFHRYPQIMGLVIDEWKGV